MKTVLLIAGYKRSGKDFSADILEQCVSDENKVEKMSFADNMKDIICSTFGISRIELDYLKNHETALDYQDPKWNKKPLPNFRTLLQRFGTEAMKPIFGEHVWTDRIISKIRKSDSNIFIIPDWRFKAEYTRMLNKFYCEDIAVITVRINREGLINTSTHLSEIDLDNFITYYNIENDGVTRSQLEFQLRNLCVGEGI